jgi:hypothetical protein
MANLAMQAADEWDWPFLIYAGTVILRRTEAETWAMRPRTLHALLKVYGDIESKKWGGGKSTKAGGKRHSVGRRSKEPPKTGYIDQINW